MIPYLCVGKGYLRHYCSEGLKEMGFGYFDLFGIYADKFTLLEREPIAVDKCKKFILRRILAFGNIGYPDAIIGFRAKNEDRKKQYDN